MLVPTRAAGDELRRTLERQLLAADRPALAVPRLATRGDFLLLARQRLASPPDLLSPFDREVILRRGAVAAEAAGFAPPFTVRPGLVAEMLALYDALRRHRRTVARFEEFLTEELAHSDDRGAARLLAQTAFLAETWRQYDACLDARGVDDEHRLRDRLIAEPAAAPIRRVIVTVTDRHRRSGRAVAVRSRSAHPAARARAHRRGRDRGPPRRRLARTPRRPAARASRS